MSASVLSAESFQIQNVGASGALVEGALPLPLNAEYKMHLVLGSHISDVTVKIRRVTSFVQDAGMVRYRMGLEFLSISEDAELLIDEMVMASRASGHGASESESKSEWR